MLLDIEDFGVPLAAPDVGFRSTIDPTMEDLSAILAEVTVVVVVVVVPIRNGIHRGRRQRRGL